MNRHYILLGPAKFAVVDTTDGIITRTSPEHKKILLGQKFVVAKALAWKMGYEIRTVKPYVCKEKRCQSRKKIRLRFR